MLLENGKEKITISFGIALWSALLSRSVLLYFVNLGMYRKLDLTENITKINKLDIRITIIYDYVTDREDRSVKTIGTHCREGYNTYFVETRRHRLFVLVSASHGKKTNYRISAAAVI